MSRCFTMLLTAALLSIPATADDFYVDAVHGNNSSNGPSPQTAWQSLEFAVAPGGSFGNALMLSGDMASQVRIADSLIARADTYGIRADGFAGQLEVINSTIVDCGHTGFASGNNQTLAGSIISGNTRDVSGPLSVENSIVSDGSAMGPGVLAVDPLFVDGPNGDYRLRSTSPGIDRVPPGGHDLLGRPRQVDGDLDLLAAGDLGAFELHSLELAGPAVGGGNLVLDLRAAGAGKAVLALAPAALAPLPALTAYGSLALDPQVAWRVLGVASQVEPLGLIVPLPASAIGATWSAQAWIASNAAPFGAAFSSAVEFTIVAP